MPAQRFFARKARLAHFAFAAGRFRIVFAKWTGFGFGAIGTFAAALLAALFLRDSSGSFGLGDLFVTIMNVWSCGFAVDYRRRSSELLGIRISDVVFIFDLRKEGSTDENGQKNRKDKDET